MGVSSARQEATKGKSPEYGKKEGEILLGIQLISCSKFQFNYFK
jgi:hypothetical protein